jgi:hypothetical protein
MDKNRKYQIESWISEMVYGFFDRLSRSGHYPTPQEAAQIAPLLQMYQSMQLEDIQHELSRIWGLLVDGHAAVYIKSTYEGLDVNIEKMPDEAK